MEKTIVVVGITGTQGGSVAQHFLSKDWTVIGITRSATSAAAQTLIAQGFQLIVADVDDTESLRTAFAPANVIFAMTDFWSPFMASYPTLSQISSRATGEHACAIEVQRGKNIVNAAAAVLRTERKLERFVYSTLPSFKELSGGKYTYAYHFDSKEGVSKYLREKRELWERSSLLNMGFYATNLAKMGAFWGGAKTLENGKYILRKTGSSLAAHPYVVPSDTGAFVDLLVCSPPKQNLLGVSEMTSYANFMKIWSEVTGVPSEVKEISVQQADEATPGGIGRESAESTACSAEFGWGEFVLPWELDPAVRLTSLRSYMEKENWEAFLNELN